MDKFPINTRGDMEFTEDSKNYAIPETRVGCVKFNGQLPGKKFWSSPVHYGNRIDLYIEMEV